MSMGLGWADVINWWRGWWDKSISEVSGEETVSTFFQTMSSGTVLGELYWKLYMGINDTGFG